MSSAPLPQIAPLWADPAVLPQRWPPQSNHAPPNMAEIWLRAGQVPLERILTEPAPGAATVEDAVYSRERFGVSCELVNGILVAKTMGYYESKVAIALAFFIQQYLGSQPIGEVSGADGPCQTLPGQIRKPDVAFTSFARIDKEGKPTRKLLPFAPDLAVEVLAPGNTAAEMEMKLEEYFATGARLVWFVEAELGIARVFTAVDQCEEIPAEGVLRGGEVLPGFELPLARLFEKAGRQAASAT